MAGAAYGSGGDQTATVSEIDRRYNSGYTLGMKTAISIPDPIFAAAEKMAKELAISRSELYAKAVADFVAAHSADSITAQINAVMETESNELDPVLKKMQQKALRHSPW